MDILRKIERIENGECKVIGGIKKYKARKMPEKTGNKTG